MAPKSRYVVDDYSPAAAIKQPHDETTIHRAAITAASYAHNRDDLARLLRMLGIYQADPETD